MAQIEPEFPTVGERPYGQKLLNALGEMVEQGNATDQVVNEGRLSEPELSAMIDTVASAAADDESTSFGQVITARTLGAAPRSLSMSGPRRLGRAPGVEIADAPLFTASHSTLANLYWPHIVDLRGIPRSNGNALPYDWAMVYSTDHQGTARVAIRLLPTGADPRNPSAWQAATETVLVDSSNGGSNTETPRLMFSESLAQLDASGNPILADGKPVRGVWLLYFSTSATSGGSVQHTRIFRANEVDAAKGNWHDTGVHVALSTAEAARVPGDGHTGYFNPFRIGAGWYAYSLLGGQDAGMYALWRSRDGLTWFRDPIPLLWDAHLVDPAMSTTARLSIGIGPLYQKDGMVYAIGGSGTPASGAVQVATRRYVGRVTDNFRAFVEQPSELVYETKAWMGSTTFGPLSIFEYGGDLYCPFSANNSSAIGLGRLVF